MNDAGRIGFVPRGEYNSAASYDFLDFVYYNGASYVAKKLTVGHEPQENNEYWQLLSSGASGEFLPLTGGYLTGSLTIKPNIDENIWKEAQVNVKRGDRGGRLVVSSNDNFGLYDITHSTWIVKSNPTGKVELIGNADSATNDEYGNNISETYATKSNPVFEESVKIKDGALYMMITESAFESDEDISINPKNGLQGSLHIDSRIDYGIKILELYCYQQEDGESYLGTPYYKWNALYTKTGTIQTSDRRQKKDEKELDDKITVKFAMGAVPKTYKYIDGTSGRIHYGFIAQDIEELMNKLGMDSKDFAGFVKSPNTRTREVIADGGTKNAEEEVIPEGEEGYGFSYSIRYQEFLPILWRFSQIMYEQVQKHEERLAKLEKYFEI